MKSIKKDDVSGFFERGESKNVINTITQTYLPYWPGFIVTILVSLLVAWFYLRYQTPIYEAEASIVLKEAKSQKDASSILEVLGVNNNGKNLENESAFLESHTLMRQVVINMGLYAQVYITGYA